jgi:hypothetical protein
VALALRAPDNVVATLEGRSADRFKFEALVGDVWCAVELRAATRSATPGAANGAPNGNGHAVVNGATNGNGHGATNGATNGNAGGALKESNGSSHWHPADDQHRQALIA